MSITSLSSNITNYLMSQLSQPTSASSIVSPLNSGVTSIVPPSSNSRSDGELLRMIFNVLSSIDIGNSFSSSTSIFNTASVSSSTASTSPNSNLGQSVTTILQSFVMALQGQVIKNSLVLESLVTTIFAFKYKWIPDRLNDQKKNLNWLEQETGIY